ncbi:related to tRNA nucleotidyltransferase, mitochondrial precursor [Cephalotrichum gorgonifer]|uniref:Related to tRNA nucleotidyltransferase, mitochondrial n=1 Tax=Cephalotrichum gorgonifer TaxID=2041049 RepID=A0AAE8MY55_9PEZI|nr:related to tRNA nucleotidyltransferase, mitochondrial precursor [Cephalotrichum gorgonifer]
MATAVLELTQHEERLRELLLDVAASIDNDCDGDGSRSPTDQNEQGTPAKKREPIVLRWAGGWVRDKLLGVQSQDIDVSINCMTGEDFGHRLRRFCDRPAIIEKHSITASDLGSLHTIKANPEKSKNLATATCRVFGADLDFVNLRKEIYADDSRNPQVEFGTPAEDASRRDATVNALFYNIHTRQVEDFVGGLDDLRSKLIRTPLEPLQTFTDDPLRVLRLVRFASRLSFSIDPETEAVMSDDRVLRSLKAKISRERVGIEVEKMLKGKHPKDALALIDRLGLYHAIFTDVTSENQPQPDISSWNAAYGFLNAAALGTEVAGPIYSRLVQGDEDAYFAWTLAALVPWDVVENPNIHLEKPRLQMIPLITRAAREGIRATNKLCTTITAAHTNRKEILKLKKLVCSGDASTVGRDTFGMAVCRWSSKTGNWRLQVLYAILVEAMEVLEGWPAPPDQLSPFVAEWLKFLDHLDELDVADAPSMKPLVDGRMLADTLGVKKGVWMAKALEVCLAWQFRNPGAKGPEGAIEETPKPEPFVRGN